MRPPRPSRRRACCGSAATLLLLGTVGVLATCKIALAILLGARAGVRGHGAVPGDARAVRRLAQGRGAAGARAAVRGARRLADARAVGAGAARRWPQTPGQIDARAAMAFFMIGAVHVALMVMVLKVAGDDGRRLERVRPAPARSKDAERAPAALGPARRAGRRRWPRPPSGAAERPAPSREIRLGPAAPAGGQRRRHRPAARAARDPDRRRPRARRGRSGREPQCLAVARARHRQPLPRARQCPPARSMEKFR